MAVQYWVGDFFVDLSRNQVTQKEQSQTIAPKALAVLTYLAENQGKVVSYDELFSNVWPDTIVTPNTLQKSIAQLRKVLGQNSQFQSYIKTHAKQGYSLECEVRWQGKVDASSLVETPSSSSDTCNTTDVMNSVITSEQQTPQTENSNIKMASRFALSPATFLSVIIIGVIVIGILGIKYFSSTQDFKFSFGELSSLTATDNKEFGAIYSPDGEYIVFNRYSEKLCLVSHIWAKNIKTQQETQLTQNMEVYGSHSFSKDGKELVFIKTENCENPVTQKKCYKLMKLDFEKALAAPQSPDSLMECKNSRIRKPTWLNNNNIALFQEFTNRWQLASYSIEDNKSKIIYSLEEGNFIDYDYSVKDDLIALMSVHNDGQNNITILKSNGQIVSSHPIEYPPEIINGRFIYPNFTPESELLIFSTGRQLFTLSFEGKITNISLPLDEPMGTPVFHPDGTRMLVIKGNWDSDIAKLAFSQTGQTQGKDSPNYTIIDRSTLSEDDAIYQPHGELIAFKSKRSGEDQIWITYADGNSPQQLTNFPTDSYIKGQDWAADGKSILVNVNNMLTQVMLDSSERSFPFSHRVEQLFQWNSEDNIALLLARINGVLTFVEVNLNNSEFNVITEKKVNWALKADDGRLVYTDQLDRFWQPGPGEYQLIEPLISQGSEKRFITKDNVLYGINEENQLWSYDLNEELFKILSNTPEGIDYITDVNQTDILFSIRITAKKEVAELTLKE